MASNHTTNYNLNQWEATDKVLRTDFSEDNAKIDAALKTNADAIETLEGQMAAVQAGMGNCRAYFQSYVGNGGSNRTFSFPFQPQLVIISGGDRVNILFCWGQAITISHRGNTHIEIQLSYGSNSVTMSGGGNFNGESYLLAAFRQMS